MYRVLLMFASFLMQPGGTSGVPPCQARIGLAQEAGFLALTSSCSSQLDQLAHYRYTLWVSRSGAGGRSQNTQGGEFALPPHQQATLSTIRLNVQPQDAYQAKLTIFDLNGRVVSQDSVSQRGF